MVCLLISLPRAGLRPFSDNCRSRIWDNRSIHMILTLRATASVSKNRLPPIRIAAGYHSVTITSCILDIPESLGDFREQLHLQAFTVTQLASREVLRTVKTLLATGQTILRSGLIPVLLLHYPTTGCLWFALRGSLSTRRPKTYYYALLAIPIAP